MAPWDAKMKYCFTVNNSIFPSCCLSLSMWNNWIYKHRQQQPVWLRNNLREAVSSDIDLRFSPFQTREILMDCAVVNAVCEVSCTVCWVFCKIAIKVGSEVEYVFQPILRNNSRLGCFYVWIWNWIKAKMNAFRRSVCIVQIFFISRWNL